MAIVIKRPTGNINSLWNQYFYTNINEIIEFNSAYSRIGWSTFGPGEPDDLYIQAYKENDVGEEQQYSMGLAGIENPNMTEVILYVLGTRAGNAGGNSIPIDARIKIGDNWSNVIALNNTAIEPTINWKQYTFTGSWSVSSDTPIALGLKFPVPSDPQYNISRTEFGVVYLGLDTGTYIADASTPILLDGTPEIKRSYFLYEGITQVDISSQTGFRRGYKFFSKGETLTFSGNASVKIGFKILMNVEANLTGISKIGRNHFSEDSSIHIDEDKKLWSWWNLDYDPNNIFSAEDTKNNNFLRDGINSNGSLTNMTISNWSLDVPLPLQKIKGKTFYPNFNKYSLEFNNTNPSSPSPQYVSFNETNQSKILKIGTNDFSITCWIKVSVVQNSNTSGVITKINYDDFENGKGFGIGLINGSIIDLNINDYYVIGVVNFNNTDTVLAFGPIINDNQWHHIAMIKDNTNLILYVDGKLDGLYPVVDHTSLSNNNTISPDNETVNLRFGQFSNVNFDSATNFIGKIDDVRFYKKSLSLKESNELWMYGETSSASYGIRSVKFIASLNSTNISGTSIPGRGIFSTIAINLNGTPILGRCVRSIGGITLNGESICGIKHRRISSTINVNVNGIANITQRGIKPIVPINISGIGYIKARSLVSLVKLETSGESIAYKTTGKEKTHIAEGGIVTNGQSQVNKLNLKFTSGLDVVSGICQSSSNVETGNTDWNNPGGLVDQLDLASLSDFGHFTNKLSDRLEGTNFGFNLNENSIIQGIKFTVYIMFGATDPYDKLQLFKFSEVNPIVNGTRYYINKALGKKITNYDPNASIEQLQNFIYEFGGHNDTWGIPATVNNINSTEFGFSVQVSYSTSFSTYVFIGAVTYACQIFYIIPVKISGEAVINSRTIIESVQINIRGSAICKTNRVYMLTEKENFISGEAVVKLPLPARHYGNGIMKVSGSAFVHWPIKPEGQVNINVAGNALTNYQFVVVGSKKFISWNDNFNRIDNLDIG